MLALPTAVGAQPLAYEDVLRSEHRVGPRLKYEPLPLDPGFPSANGDRDEGAVGAVYGDRLEFRPQKGGDAFNWDVSAEMGSARNRLWLATTGDAMTPGGIDYLEVQALYSRPIAGSAINLQAGVRRDFVPRPRRSYAVLGAQGNIGDPLYIGAFAFLSHRGELSGRLFLYYDLSLGDRLILQPAAESEIAAADVPALGIGSGFVYGELGLRLRYRLHEAFAPYVGINWERLLGRTARFARAEGEEQESANLVLGVRSYF